MKAPPLARDLFDLPADVVWALHCAEGPVPRAAVEAAGKWLQAELRPWTLGPDDFRRPATMVREEAAKLFGAAV